MPPAASHGLDAATRDLVTRAARLEKYPLARLISIAEGEGAAARDRRTALFRHLAPAPCRGVVVGVTGSPGAGKSSLIGRVAEALLAGDPAIRIAILAIDPTSGVSGGALLGDRVRTRFPAGEARVFFRSQATEGDLGGVGRRTFAATRLLRYLVDLVLVETVGIGQTEIEVSRLAEQTVLVLQPMAGDHVQYMKAGVMEVPDVFVINKCDATRLAQRSLRELEAALDHARIGRPGGRTIFLTSAATGAGVEELAAFLGEMARRAPTRAMLAERERHFVAKAVRDAYGRFGLEVLAGFLATGSRTERLVYEELEAAALAAVRARVR